MSVSVPEVAQAFTAAYFDRVLEVGDARREDAPVYRAIFPDGLPIWVITRYADVRAALTDPRLRKGHLRLIEIATAKLAERGEPAELNALYSAHMLFADPPDHTRLRALLTRGFTARRIEALRPRVEQLTADLLDALPLDEPTDLVAGYALPLPATVIAELLGIPVADRIDFQRWAAAIMQQTQESAVPASRALVGYLIELIERKTARPADDLLSALVRETETGDRLTPQEVLGTAVLLLVAGHETTANLIGLALRQLLTDPDLAQRLRDQPAGLRPAIEELLRVDSPVMLTSNRYTAEPVTIGEVTIPAGEIVKVSLGSANRDARRFGQPELLDIDRDTAGHLAFGHGLHYCIGAPLARLEAEIALGAWLRRFPHARLAVPPDALR